jgi:hypothetical protein
LKAHTDVSQVILKGYSAGVRAILQFMPVRSCRVTIQDMDGVGHAVEVTAARLYHAVAQGLAAIRGQELRRFNLVKVSVADVRVEHEVKLGDF